MAIDSELKRGSAVGVSLPWRTILPVAHGSVSAADRATAGLHYSGTFSSGGGISCRQVIRPRGPRRGVDAIV